MEHERGSIRTERNGRKHVDYANTSPAGGFGPLSASLAPLGLISYLAFATPALAVEPSTTSDVARQSLDDAWWTGPIVAAGAGTMPQGHVLVEPYVYDVIRQDRFDTNGDRHAVPRSDGFGSLTYILYGVTDRFTAGLIPTFGYTDASEGSDSSGVQTGDVTLQGQYRLSKFREGSHVPTVSLVLQETLPTGKYDELGAHPNDGFGSGAYTTTIALYSQYYFWMPNGRILRTRFNVSQAFSNTVDVEGVSVYGTGDGFRGEARPGDVFTANSSWEYSITRNWVFALDFVYQHDASTSVTGSDATNGISEPVNVDSGSAWRFGVAPAVEYNFNSRIGVIAGARWFAAGKNTSATVTPVMAVNMVF
ncbi:MAG: transporter [Povalibacter sp.]